MSCILTISGEGFNVDAFVEQSGITAYSIFRKGEARFQSKPEGAKFSLSGCSVEVSKAEFNDFKQQVADAISYLDTNGEALKYIPYTKGIKHACLDFGVTFDPPNGFVQSQYMPSELLIPATKYGISINLSMYTPASDEEESN